MVACRHDDRYMRHRDDSPDVYCTVCEVEKLQAEIERLTLENNQLHTECGHLQADKEELRHELCRCRQLLATAVDAWECGQMVRDQDGVVLANWKAAILPQAWCGAARAAGGEDE